VLSRLTGLCHCAESYWFEIGFNPVASVRSDNLLQGIVSRLAIIPAIIIMESIRIFTLARQTAPFPARFQKG
jgi:hypothetical protein